MEHGMCGRAAHGRLCAKVCMCVAPETALGVCRAYPCGRPTICELDGEPCERCIEARYVLRQTFVAEIPIAVRSGVSACRPRMRLCGCERAKKEDI